MKQIAFKTSPRFAGPLDAFGNPMSFLTKHFKKNYVKTIQPGRGLTKVEMRKLPKGITVVKVKAIL